MSIFNTKYEIRDTRYEEGTVLLFTLMVMVALTSVVGTYIGLVHLSTKSTGAQIADSQALYLADAGIHYGIYNLKQDSEWAGTASPVSLGEGTFFVDVNDLGGNNYRLTSTGTVDGLQRVIEQTVTISSGDGSYPEGVPEAFEYAMHSFDSHINFQNSEGAVNGSNVAAGQQVKNESGIDLEEGYQFIDGSGVDEPDPVDMSGYQSIADNVESGGFTFLQDQTYGSAGNEQIWYIQGNCTIEEGATIYGSVIAENNISLGTNGITVDAASGFPALIAGNNITESGLSDSTISGLIYADNNISFDDLENVTFNGTILSGNNISMKRGEGLTINYDSDIITNPPPYFDGYEEGSITITLQNDWSEI